MIGLFYLAAMCERALSYGIARGLHGVTHYQASSR